MDYFIKYLERRIEHAKKRAEELRKAHGDDPGKTHTYHGGRNLGLWEGELSAYEKVLDKVRGDGQ